MKGFPETFKMSTHRNIAYKQFGDSVSIPVLAKIFTNILKAYPPLKTMRKKLDIQKNVQEDARLTLNI